MHDGQTREEETVRELLEQLKEGARLSSSGERR